jgi:hypothetical protein
VKRGDGRTTAGRRKEEPMRESSKKEWTQPQLILLGDVKELTLAKNKHYGVTDGFLFNNVPISG